MKVWLKRHCVVVVLWMGAMLVLACCWPPRCHVEFKIEQK